MIQATPPIGMDWLGGVATPEVADATANAGSVQIAGIVKPVSRTP